MLLAFSATVALLVWMGFFMMGSLPLLVLKHDTPVDAGFIRGLFNLYYWAVTLTASAGAIAFGLADRPILALVMTGIAAFALVSRHVIVGRMDRLRSTMTASDVPGIARFRRLHIGGMLLNVAQLSAVVVALTHTRL
jgi:hypothetical protein